MPRRLDDPRATRWTRPPISLNEAITHEVIDKSIALLETRCVRFNGPEPKWRALFAEQQEGIQRSTSAGELEALINKVLSRGGLSHVAFFHGSAQRVPARYAVNATFCAFDSPKGLAAPIFQSATASRFVFRLLAVTRGMAPSSKGKG
jgi:hypothetical protein